MKPKRAETHAVNNSEILFAREENKREAMRDAADYKDSFRYMREQAAKEVATWKWEDFHAVEAAKAKARSQDDPADKPTPTKKANA
jgi:hypothetical protein